MDVGRRVPPLEEGDAGSQASERELRKRREREEEQEVEELGCCGTIGCRGGTDAVPAHALLHGIGRRGVGDGRFSLLLSFVIPLVRALSSWDRPGRRAKGSLQRAATARTADRKTG